MNTIDKINAFSGRLKSMGKLDFTPLPPRRYQFDMFKEESREGAAQREIHLRLLTIVACELRRLDRGTA